MDLVLQGAGATPARAAELVPLVGARAPEARGSGAYLLRQLAA